MKKSNTLNLHSIRGFKTKGKKNQLQVKKWGLFLCKTSQSKKYPYLPYHLAFLLLSITISPLPSVLCPKSLKRNKITPFERFSSFVQGIESLFVYTDMYNEHFPVPNTKEEEEEERGSFITKRIKFMTQISIPAPTSLHHVLQMALEISPLNVASVMKHHLRRCDSYPATASQ